MNEEAKKEKRRAYMRIYLKTWRNTDKRRKYEREWKRNYKLKNPEIVNKKRRERYNREKKNPEWLSRHRAYMREYLKRWRKDNLQYAQKHREQANKYQKQNGKKIYQQRMQRPNERLFSVIRSRICNALKHGYKSDRTEKLIGITIEELRDYIEGKFQTGMTWENYGFYGWHIDHIKPLSSFDLTNPEEQKKAFHYTNLQPLWAKDNLSKSAKILN